jgi:hypothetical protein
MLGYSFITAFIVLFLHACTWEGMIFETVHDVLFNVHPWLKKPLYDCPICMSIWWGPAVAAVGMLGFGWQILNTWALLITIASAAGINTVLIYIIENGKNEAADSAGSDH